MPKRAGNAQVTIQGIAACSHSFIGFDLTPLHLDSVPVLHRIYLVVTPVLGYYTKDPRTGDGSGVLFWQHRTVADNNKQNFIHQRNGEIYQKQLINFDVPPTSCIRFVEAIFDIEHLTQAQAENG